MGEEIEIDVDFFRLHIAIVSYWNIWDKALLLQVRYLLPRNHKANLYMELAHL